MKIVLMVSNYNLNDHNILINTSPIGYIDELITEAVKIVEDKASPLSLSCPLPLCSEYYQPRKEIAVKEHQSRFA